MSKSSFLFEKELECINYREKIFINVYCKTLTNAFVPYTKVRQNCALFNENCLPLMTVL